MNEMEERNIYIVLKDCYERINKNMGISHESAFDELTKLLFVKWSNNSLKKYSTRYSHSCVDWIKEDFDCLKKDYSYTGLFTPSDSINIATTCLEYIVSQLQDISIHTYQFAEAYERLIGEVFIKGLDRFYTDRRIAQYISKVVNPEYDCLVCDPCCGSGGLLVSAYNEFSSGEILGCDTNPRMARIAKMNLMLHYNDECEIHRHNGLTDVGGILEGRCDVVIMNPPTNIKLSNADRLTTADLPSIEEQSFYSRKYREYDKSVSRQKEMANRIWTDNRKGCPYSELFDFNYRELDLLFVQRAWNLLKPGGRAAILLGNRFFTERQHFEKIRGNLATKAYILNITRFANRTIDGYSSSETVLFIEKPRDLVVTMDYPLTVTDISEETLNNQDLMDAIAKENNKFINNEEKPSNKNTKVINLSNFDIDWNVARFFNTIISVSPLYDSVLLSELIKPAGIRCYLEEDIEYQRITVKTNNGGIKRRDRVLGKNIKNKRQNLVGTGQLIISRLDAKKGGIGIVPKELDRAIVTGEFMIFDIDTNKVNPTYLELIIGSKTYQNIFQSASYGSTTMTRLAINTLLNISVPLPPLVVQEGMVAKIEETRKEIAEREKTLEYEMSNFNDMVFGKNS